MRSVPIPELYRSLHSYLLQRIPDDGDPRLTNWIDLMMGMFQWRSIQLKLLARKTPIRAKKLSIVKRFERFLNNPGVRVRAWFHPFAELLRLSAANAGQVHWMIAASKVAFGFRLLMVRLAVQRRSLPLAWTWWLGSGGHSSPATQVKLLDYVYRLLPRRLQVTLVGDSQFGNRLLIENRHFWGWDYAWRQAGDHRVMLRGTGKGQRLDPFGRLNRQSIWVGPVLLTKASRYPTHLLLYWQTGEDKPGYRATNWLDARATLRW